MDEEVILVKQKQMCEIVLNHLFSEDTDRFLKNCEFSSDRMAFMQGMNYALILCIAKLDQYHAVIVHEPQDERRMYEELVKRLREPCQYENCILCQQAADAIEELTGLLQEVERARDEYKERLDKISDSMQNCWIPVTERLPQKECETYWICTDSGHQCECRWTNNRFGVGESDNWGWNIMDTPQYQEVIAWRKLPKPYQPPKEEA